MAVRFHGVMRRMGPVEVAASQEFEKGDVVQIVSGLVEAAAADDNTDLAIALHKWPDSNYEGTQTHVEVGVIGPHVEVEVPFTNSGGSNTLAKADIGGGPFELNDQDGTIDLDGTANGVFIPLRLGRDTAIGDATGFLIGVFTDGSAFGGS